MNNRRRKARIRLARIERLREIGAPAWVIKWEQVALALERRGRSVLSRHAAPLYERHVYPRMESRLQ